ncbi:MAG TPA: outer membrane beta-barrel protein [Prolixibacteraceae bacterium]|nr:outer membrane beta-barrel protein [Prolixibacteraceae bacterium]HPR62122.1 outer membrane beta-barrel protein [Prolixibacteraceae bacterium]
MIRLLLVAVLIMWGSVSMGQNFRLGFQASPHFTWMSSTNGGINNIETKPGIKYGLEADIFMAGYQRYILNTGLFVSNHSFSARYVLDQSFDINTTTFDKSVDLTFKMNYIELPLNIKLRSDQFYRMTFYGQFGLTNLFNISASASSDDASFSGEKLNEGINNRSIRFYNLCMLMGGGMEYDVGGNTAINLGVQYSNGLSDVTNLGRLNEKTVFNSLRLVVGVMF